MSASKGKLAGKIAIITGASQGIGSATAFHLAAEGIHLVLASRNAEKLQPLAQLLNERYSVETLVVPTDVSRPEQVEALVQRTLEVFGRIDILVNNAGVAGKIALLQEIPVSEIDRTLDINLKGPIYCMRAVLPTMIHQHAGIIININSVAGKTAFPYWSIYDASKFGLHAVTEAVAEEQRQNGIKVVGIYPGAVNTPIWETIELDHEPKHEGMLDAETVAETVVYILNQPEKALIRDVTLEPLRPAL